MINKVLLIGNLGRDPEVRYTSGGQAVCSLRIATTRSWFDKNASERREETEWHDIEVWGKAAEAAGEHLSKGRQVYVEGRLKTDSWDDKQSGAKRYRVKVVAETVRFLGGGGRREQSDAERDHEDRGGVRREEDIEAAPMTGNEDIPF